MKTRTLLLLAVTCGLAILLAGGLQLLRVSDQSTPTTSLVLQQVGKAGDATVTLLAVADDGTTLRATVRIGGVDDSDGLRGFTLVAPGKVVTPTAVTGSCESISVAPRQCDLVFPTLGLQGDVRQLLFRRAEQQLRWCLAGC
jgi:hypothetical protein